MENVIFNGTATRRALGLAEVSLSIENTRNVLPTEYTDVTISRRLYRSGESEYLLNGTVCRLKDILDLFMDTGMGAGAYSVIELKMIEDILSENAEDRRRLFEEAAGITKYKLRRGQALRRLDTTQADLTRLADLTDEIEKNVRSLARQAKKAQRHETLQQRLRALELALAAADYERLATERRTLDAEAAALGDQVAERTAQLQRREAESEALRTALLDRMHEHIDTLAGRYRGQMHAWDVVNEAIDEGEGWRRSPWWRIIGDDFMEQAFRMARSADPQASLLYNDYNMHNPGKRKFLVTVLRDYLDRGVPIDGIGLQGHLGLDAPDLEEWERSIATYADMGLDVHVTELEVDPLPNPSAPSAEVSNRFEYSAGNDPWPDGLPDEMQARMADRYEQVFNILLRYRDSVKRVTFWGLHDGISWKNNFPIRGRTNHPLLFDRALQPKPAYARLMTMPK